MQRTKYIYWQDDDTRLGYLEEYPDYWTQGERIAELEENLRDIYSELTSGSMPFFKRHSANGSFRFVAHFSRLCRRNGTLVY